MVPFGQHDSKITSGSVFVSRRLLGSGNTRSTDSICCLFNALRSRGVCALIGSASLFLTSKKVPLLRARLHEWRRSFPTLEEAPQQAHGDGSILRVRGVMSVTKGYGRAVLLPRIVSTLFISQEPTMPFYVFLCVRTGGPSHELLVSHPEKCMVRH